MKEIPLTQGKVALVDDEDYPVLTNFKWCYHEKRVKRAGLGWGYANRRLLKGEPNFPGHIAMHETLLKKPAGFFIDHINGDGIDNRRENLRIVTNRENIRNQTHRRVAKSSKYPGVSRNPARGKLWRTSIVLNGTSRYLGMYDDELEAATVYRVACAVLVGE